MSKVFVVMRHVRSEGDDVEGVFTTKEKAEEFAGLIKARLDVQFGETFDLTVDIEEHNLDKES
jgi:hypothetical protein